MQEDICQQIVQEEEATANLSHEFCDIVTDYMESFVLQKITILGYVQKNLFENLYGTCHF